MNISIAQYKELIKNKARPRARHLPGEMNGLERSYADYLNILFLAGEIQHWIFEPFKLKLAEPKKTYYIPDFLVIANNQIEIHETKGFMEDDALVKLKVAADKFWFFSFYLIKKNNGNFERKLFSS